MSSVRVLLSIGAAVVAVVSLLPRMANAIDATPPAPPWRSALSAEHPLVGTIYRPDQQRVIAVTELLNAMRSARFVLLGERHDNSDHHRLQAWLLERMIAGGRRPAMAFEMFGTEKRPAIEKHLEQRPRDADGLGAATDWANTGWPDWALYRPIVQAALDAGLPIIAANLPDTEVKAMSRRQQISPERIDQLGLNRPLPGELHDSLVRDIRESHCNLLPDRAVLPMVMTQRAKDASMAMAMAEAARAPGIDGAVLIAGAGHARKDRGVPMVLRDVAPDADSFAIAFVEVSDELTDPTAYGARYAAEALPFDAVWFTPRVGVADPCAALAEHFKKNTPASPSAE